MMSDRLRERPLFTWREDKMLDRETREVIDRGVRKVVMLMRALETHGYGSREAIEEAVLQAFEKAEYFYYALDEHEIMQAIDMEKANEKSRGKARRSRDNESFRSVEYGLREYSR